MNAIKRLLSLALLIIVCNTATGQGLLTLNDDPLSYENLRGPVKEMELLDMSVYEDGETTIWDTIYLLFNEDGQILQRNCFMHAEYPYIIYLYTNGRLTEEKWWNNYDSIRRQYHYSPNGCLSYAVEFYYEEGEQKIYDTNQYHCDSLCRITMQIHNHFQDTVRCTYDENGRMTKWCNWERCEEGARLLQQPRSSCQRAKQASVFKWRQRIHLQRERICIYLYRKLCRRREHHTLRIHIRQLRQLGDTAK